MQRLTNITEQLRRKDVNTVIALLSSTILTTGPAPEATSAAATTTPPSTTKPPSSSSSSLLLSAATAGSGSGGGGGESVHHTVGLCGVLARCVVLCGTDSPMQMFGQAAFCVSCADSFHAAVQLVCMKR